MNIVPGRYVVAVSGGIDSVVLLDMLVNQASKTVLPNLELIVAHFDHGMREDSAEDAEFVGELAKIYGLPFETERVELGSDASEAQAREARYDFLKRVQQKHIAAAIITAHHQDDLLETSIINMLRGTGHRGLHSLKSRDELLRPLLHLKKVDIVEYAKEHKLQWREDSTNQDTKFLRNKIRLDVVPRGDAEWRQKMLGHIEKASTVGAKLDREIGALLTHALRNGQIALSRSWFVKLPHVIAGEVIVALLRKLRVADVDKHLVERLTLQIKTARPGKKLDINKDHYVLMTKRSARVMNRQTHKTVRV
ncbi:MAG: tRNA lysidine(34) synthetase TilS [Patescibacteria group bacterium]